MTSISTLYRSCGELTYGIKLAANTLQAFPGNQEISNRVNSLFAQLVRAVPAFEDKKSVLELQMKWKEQESLSGKERYELRATKRRKVDGEQTSALGEAFVKELNSLEVALKKSFQQLPFQTISDLDKYYEAQKESFLSQVFDQEALYQPVVMQTFHATFPVFESIAKDALIQIANFEFGEELAYQLDTMHENIYNKAEMLRIILLYGFFFQKEKIKEIAKEFGVEETEEWKSLTEEVKKRRPSLQKEKFFSSSGFKNEEFSTSLNRVIAKMGFEKIGADRAVFSTLCQVFFSCAAKQEKSISDFEKQFMRANTQEEKADVLVEMLKTNGKEEKALEFLAQLQNNERGLLDQFLQLFLERRKYTNIFYVYEKLQDEAYKFNWLANLLCSQQVFHRNGPKVIGIFANESFNVRNFCSSVEPQQLLTIYKNAKRASVHEISCLIEQYIPENERNVFSFSDGDRSGQLFLPQITNLGRLAFLASRGMFPVLAEMNIANQIRNTHLIFGVRPSFEEGDFDPRASAPSRRIEIAHRFVVSTRMEPTEILNENSSDFEEPVLESPNQRSNGPSRNLERYFNDSDESDE